LKLTWTVHVYWNVGDCVHGNALWRRQQNILTATWGVSGQLPNWATRIYACTIPVTE
jgi:hypothetical protein